MFMSNHCSCRNQDKKGLFGCFPLVNYSGFDRRQSHKTKLAIILLEGSFRVESMGINRSNCHTKFLNLGPIKILLEFEF